MERERNPEKREILAFVQGEAGTLFRPLPEPVLNAMRLKNSFILFLLPYATCNSLLYKIKYII